MSETFRMESAEDVSLSIEQLEANLAPESIRFTLAFAGLYQITHELLKYSVIEKVKGYYGHVDMDGAGWIYPGGDTEYSTEVLSRDRNVFRASLRWLRDVGAVTDEQVLSLDRVYAHRHELTHELVRFVVDPRSQPDFDLFLEALGGLKAIDRFWLSIERDIGTFGDDGEIDLDDVTPSTHIVLALCIEALAPGGPAQ